MAATDEQVLLDTLDFLYRVGHGGLGRLGLFQALQFPAQAFDTFAQRGGQDLVQRLLGYRERAVSSSRPFIHGGRRQCHLREETVRARREVGLFRKLAGAVPSLDLRSPLNQSLDPFQTPGAEALLVLFCHRGAVILGRLIPLLQVQAQILAGLQVVHPQFQHLAIEPLASRDSLQVRSVVVDLAGRDHVPGELRGAMLDDMPVHFKVQDGRDPLLGVFHRVLVILVPSVRFFGHQRFEVHLRDRHRRIEAREVLDAGEDRCHGIVVFGRNGIELVVVAASAAQRESHEDLRRRVDLLIDHVVLHLDLVLLDQGLRPNCQESSRDDAFLVDPIAPFRRQQVTCKLLDDELIERGVAVEGVDDVVAIAPCVRHLDVVVQTRRVRVARHVEPVASPLLAISRGLQQTVDEPSECAGGLVCQEFLDFRFCGGEAVKVVLGAPQESESVSAGRRGKLLLLKPRQDEVVDRSLRPAFVLHARRPFRPDGLECPVACLLGGPLRPRITVLHDRLRLCARPRRSLADPACEGFDLTFRQFRRRGHLDQALVANSCQQAAGVRRVPGECRARVASLVEAFGRCQVQPSGLQLLAVAGGALVHENGTNLFLEELFLLGGCGGNRGSDREDGHQRE